MLDPIATLEERAPLPLDGALSPLALMTAPCAEDQEYELLVQIEDDGGHTLSPSALSPQPSAPPPPLSEEQAEELVRRIVGAQHRVEVLKANAKRRIADAEEQVEYLLQSYSDRLREYALDRLNGKRRSVQLLEGVVGFRTSPARLKVVDDGAALEWADLHLPEAVTRKVDVARVGKPARFESIDPETGEVGYRLPPGFDVAPGGEVFYVKAATRTVVDGENGGAE